MTVEITWMGDHMPQTFEVVNINIDEHRQIVLIRSGSRGELKVPLDNVRHWTASE
jgi:hypothetical protein